MKTDTGREADYSPPFIVVKNAWSYTYTPLYVLTEWSLIKQRNNFTLP
jgi:hypothetical protein